MNEYYAELFKPVERLGGVVSNLSGDAMLAIWAASTSQVAARQQACLAAFEIAEALERFNQRFAEGQTLRTRLGLHSGQMLLGSVGASRHYQYEAMGDMINTAARIQGLSKHLGTRMLASEETILDVQGLLTRPLGRFLLAGKSAPVSVVELLGRAQDATPQSIQLRDEFAQALLAYRDREWGDATRHLSAILRRFPEDGPSRFYQQRCHACLRDPPDETWRPTIRIEQK
jgi:adenylate cyclase